MAPASWAAGKTDQLSYLDFTRTGGFCLRGIPEDVRWAPDLGSDPVMVWGSFCDNDQSQGVIVSDPFFAPSSLSFYLSGYAGAPGLKLYLRNLQTGEQFDLIPQRREDGWQLQTFFLPETWVGKPVEMIGEDQATGVHGWFGFTAPRLPNPSLALGYIDTNRAPHGFCNQNHLPWLTWGSTSPPPGITVWHSYCAAGDADTGFAASEPFPARSFAGLYIAGYPEISGVRLRIENVANKQQLPVHVDPLPGEVWRLYYVPLPREWLGHPVRVLAEDTATTPYGWVAFAVVPPVQWGNKGSFGVRLLALIATMFLLTMLPATAACLLAARRGARSVLDLTAVGMVTLGLVGYGAFWFYFLSSTAGKIYSWGTLLSCVAIVLWTAVNPSEIRNWTALRPLIVPFLLIACASAFMLSLGFVYGKSNPVQDYAARRFGPPFLSVDNWLPKILADDVYQAHIPKPMIGDWLSSDRPPLQAGNILWSYAWTHGDRDVSYQVLGTILQLTFLAGLWAYLSAAGVSRKAMLLVMATAVFAGFTLENAFFVWPKLFPVAYLLIISGYLLTDRYREIRSDWRIGAMLGGSAALAMLCHGGSAFGLFGIALTMVALLRFPDLRFAGAFAVAAIVVMLPWSLYQKYYDPPGDRLLKMHLAATPEPHPETKFSTLLIQKYKEAGWHGLLVNKRNGFEGLFDTASFQSRVHDMRFLFVGTHDQRAREVALLRDIMFLRWFWSIDFLSFVVFLWLMCLALKRPRSPDFRNCSLLWICTGFSLISWCLLMFGGGTIVHQGCYFTEITAFAAAVLTLWAVRPLLAGFVVASHVAFTLTIYVFLRPTQPVGVATYFGPTDKVLVFATLLSAGAFLFVLWMARNEGEVKAGQFSVSSQAPRAIRSGS